MPPPKKPDEPKPQPERTAMLPTLQVPTDDAFIGHEAPTRVGIDLATLKAAHDNRTTTAPLLAAAEDVTPTPLGEEDLMSLEALEVLAGQKLPARLRRFFQAEAAGHEHRYHPSLGAGSLHFRPASLGAAWAAVQGAAQPALLLVPIASAGLQPAILAVEVSTAALPVHRHEPQSGFSLIAPTFEGFLAALTDEPAGATMAIG